MGEAEAIKLLTDLKLVEYRTIFETVNAQGLHQLKHLAHESREFEQCLKQFQTCQGKSVSNFFLLLFLTFYNWFCQLCY